MLTKNVIAIDLAKNVLQACHISVHGELLSNKPLSRQKMKEFLAKAKPFYCRHGRLLWLSLLGTVS